MHEHITRDPENHYKLFIDRLNKLEVENKRLKDVETKHEEEIACLKARCTCQ